MDPIGGQEDCATHRGIEPADVRFNAGPHSEELKKLRVHSVTARSKLPCQRVIGRQLRQPLVAALVYTTVPHAQPARNPGIGEKSRHNGASAAALKDAVDKVIGANSSLREPLFVAKPLGIWINEGIDEAA
jgi:hypothetical protein